MFLKSFFFFFSIFAVINECISFYDTKVLADFRRNIQSRSKLPKDEQPDLTTNQIIFWIFTLGYAIWTIAGALWSSQWLLFILIIVLSLIPNKRLNIIQLKIDALLSLIILIFANINAFILHINLLDFVRHLF